MGVKQKKWLILKENGKSTGEKEIYITRDFSCYVNILDNRTQEICFVKPISDEGYQLRNEGA